MGNGGEIFVLDMGNPVNIKDKANEWIRLSVLEPEKDINIEYIGTRPGEKLFEELKTSEESVVGTSHEKILMMKNLSEVNWDKMVEHTSEILKSTKSNDINKISNKIIKCVPEYSNNLKELKINMNKSKISGK